MKKATIMQSEDINNDDDAYEDYFEKQMEKDTMGIEEYEQKIDYFEELKKVQERVSELPDT